MAVFEIYKPESAFFASLNRLKLEYIDLYLIHWPFVGWKNAWRTLEKIYSKGLVKAIGVSNFGIKQLEELKDICTIKPMVNQIEVSPFFSRTKLVDYCQAEDIAIEAYSPLTRGKRIGNKIITSMARAYNKAPAQIMLRWGLQRGLIVLPKSQDKSHIKENIEVFDFDLDTWDMRKLNSLNENYSVLFPVWSHD